MLTRKLTSISVFFVACSGALLPHLACNSEGEPGVSLPPQCTDAIRSDGEDGIDCGGICPRCDGAECTSGEQCVSGGCTAGKCDPTSSKTCGVGLPNACSDGEKCVQDLDCASDYCEGTCGPPPPGVHADGRRNGGETGVDCGGSAKPDKLCPAGQKCKTSDDCISNCSAQGLCDAPSSTDGKKNNGESDVDCGGPNAPHCALGRKCNGNDDCELLACTSNACVVPTATDKVKNGGETDIDCGGSGVSGGGISYTAPRCNDAQTCAVDADCKTGACAPTGRCEPKSCDTAETAGIVTCGAKEVGDPAATHESCCKSLRLPTRTTRRLDKYEITAGRFRSFLTAVGPNVRAWVEAFSSDAANANTQLKSLVTSYPTVKQIYPADLVNSPLNLVAHMASDIDNYDGNRGCYNGEGSYGANTYWLPPDQISPIGLPAHVIARDIADTKPLNCAMPIMFAAFCAWDGGELATLADLLDAWGPETYPWGKDDIKRPNYNWCNGNPGTGGFACQDTSLGNNGIFYQFPIGTDLIADMSPLIASPGRFTADATANKVGADAWQDLYGNLAEYAGDFGGSSDFCDFSATPAPGAPTCTRNGHPGQLGTMYTGIPIIRMLGVAWEGHVYPRGSPPQGSSFPATFQYGKFGARCARTAQ